MSGPRFSDSANKPANFDLAGLKDLVRDAFRDVGDADRCLALHITPATGTLHRRLRETANAMNTLIAEVEGQRILIQVMTPGFEEFAKAKRAGRQHPVTPVQEGNE